MDDILSGLGKIQGESHKLWQGVRERTVDYISAAISMNDKIKGVLEP